MAVQRYLYSCMGELVRREALIGEAQSTGIDTYELDRVACSKRAVTSPRMSILEE